MKTFIIIFVLLLLSSCELLEPRKYKRYTAEYTLKVNHNNGSIDTLSAKVFNDYRWKIYTELSQGELRTRGGNYTFASYVQSYEILKDSIYLTNQD